MTDILALDLATTTGWARGSSARATVPMAGSITFYGKSDNRVFSDALVWFSEFLEPLPRPDLIVIEAMLPPDAMRGRTTRMTRDRLAGLHAIARAVALCRGIVQVETVSVHAVRRHFVGDRSMQAVSGKAAVMEKCRMLKWKFDNDNEADALALWSYACGMLAPETALRASPLFQCATR